MITRSSTISASREGNTLSGYAIRWNDESRVIREQGKVFTERIERSACDITGKGFDDIKLFFQHNNEMPLARTNNNSLRLTNDPSGLWFEAELPNTTLASDIKDLLNRGTLDGSMSFGFTASDIRWSRDGQSRSIHEGKLFEISLVVDPAYKNTQSELRSDSIVLLTDQEIETKRINQIRRNRTTT